MLDLTVLILALNEANNLRTLLPRARLVLETLGIRYELLLVDGGSTDETVTVALNAGARVVKQRKPGYGNAFKEGASEAKGQFVVTFDADCSHPPELISRLWDSRTAADVVVASRYIPGGKSSAPLSRVLSSMLLNRIFMSALSLPVRDLSSGFRLYHSSALSPGLYVGSHFDILVEVIVRAICSGHRIKEIPLVYEPRRTGSSHIKLFKFAAAYLTQFVRLWRLRNSIQSADYDHRAFDSRLWPQRYWQRRRFRLIKGFLDPRTKNVLDVGCGTSRIIQSLPDAVAGDISIDKLRFLRSTNSRRVCLSTLALPFQNDSFDAVIHSEVLEHVEANDIIFSEIRRVLRPGGVLVVGTPDYGRVWWPAIESLYNRILPDAYGQEHITRYTRLSLVDALVRNGFIPDGHAYICGAELIIKATRGGSEQEVVVP